MKFWAVFMLIGLAFMSATTARADWYNQPDQGLIYKVEASGDSLSLISLQLYGSAKKWKEISRWNHLEAPYRLRIGQILRLEKPPVGTREECDKRILSYWRKKMGLNEPAKSLTQIQAPVETIDPRKAESIKEHFQQNDFAAAYEQLASLNSAAEEPVRAPASSNASEDIASEEPVNVESAKEKATEALTSNGLLWLDGDIAETIYFSLSQVSEKPLPAEFDLKGFKSASRNECVLKQGINLICIRCPSHASEEVIFETKCAGSSATNTTNQKSPPGGPDELF